MVPAFALPLILAASLVATGSGPTRVGSPDTGHRTPRAEGATEGTLRPAHVTLEARGARARHMVAELLVDADAIDLLAADSRSLRFAVDRGGDAHELSVTLAADGRVRAATLRPVPRSAPAAGELSWLGLAIGDREAVRAATVSDDGVVVLELDDGARIPLTDEAGDDYVGC